MLAHCFAGGYQEASRHMIAAKNIGGELMQLDRVAQGFVFRVDFRVWSQDVVLIGANPYADHSGPIGHIVDRDWNEHV